MNDKILLKRNNKLIFVERQKILSIQKENKKVRIITNQTEYLSGKSLSEIEESLGSMFFRIRNDVIINMLNIKNLDLTTNKVLIGNSKEYRIAKRRKKEFVEKLDQIYNKLN